MDLRIAKRYYIRKDIQNILALHSKCKEVVPCYNLESFGKRPDIIEYPNDIANLAEKGATSFHSSEELWKNPLELSTALNQEKTNELRIGWDFIIDLDSNFIEFSKVAAQLIIEALHFHNIQGFGIKFSGRAGWHIGIPFSAFPNHAKEIEIKNFFPQGPRLIASYLKELIASSLKERILALSSPKELGARLNRPSEHFFINNQFNPFSVVDIDTVLISPRHLYRMPYSLNEKTGLSSIVVTPAQLKHFKLGWAKPERVYPKPFMPCAEKNEASQLFLQALDWQKSKEKLRLPKLQGEKIGDERERSQLVIKDASPALYPPCVKSALGGIKHDGRKRCLFILLNFFKSINLKEEEIKEKIEAWNKLNYKPLKEGYVASQLSWHFRQKAVLPPNCEKIKASYADLCICKPDFLCSKIKNPVNYVVRSFPKKAKTQEKKRAKRAATKKEKAWKTTASSKIYKDKSFIRRI